MKANNHKKIFDRVTAPANGRWRVWRWLSRSYLRTVVALCIGIIFVLAGAQFFLSHLSKKPMATQANLWHVVTVPTFRCNNLPLAECLSKFNRMNVGSGTVGGNILCVNIDDSATTISGTAPGYLTKSQFADMLAEAYAYNQTTNMNLLRDLAQTSSITLNVRNTQAADLIKTLVEVAGLSGVSLYFNGPLAQIRRGPKELRVCVVKAKFPFEAFYRTAVTSELVNVTTFFRESRDPLSVRYHVPSGNVIVLAIPGNMEFLLK